MKKVLFFATALSVAATSFAPAAFAVTKDPVNNVPLTLTSTYTFAGDYDKHTSDKPLVADVKDDETALKFNSKASLDMTDVAKRWKTEKDAAIAKGATEDVLKEVANQSLSGAFTITITADDAIENGPELVGDENVQTLFDVQTPVQGEDGSWTVTAALKSGVYEALDAYLTSAAPAPLTFTSETNTVSGAGTTYEITAQLTGSVSIHLFEQDYAIEFNSTQGTDYLKLVAMAPVEKPSLDTFATAAPAEVKSDFVVTVGDLVTPVNEIKKDEVQDYTEILDENAEPDHYQVVVTKGENEGKYGEDYVAFIEVNGESKYLTEKDYNAILSNQYSEVSDDIKGSLTDITPGDVKIVAVEGTDIEVTPVYSVTKDENTEYIPLPGLKGDTTATAPTETPTDAPTTVPTEAPTETPTTTPSGSHGGGGGGGGGSSSGTSKGTTIASVGSQTVASNDQVNGVTETVNFQDLDSVPWAKEAIDSLVGLGVLNGRSNVEFAPNATVTRAEFAKMVYIAFKLDKNPTAQKFTDVAPSDWHYKYVQGAADAGIVLGISDTEFAPNATITREQMAAMIYRAVEYVGGHLPAGTLPFADAASISDYAKDAVASLSAKGVINGMDDNTFAPQATATRAQAACIIYQYFQAIGK